MLNYLLAANPDAWNPAWYWMVILAFISFIGFAQIDSAWADKHKWNRKLFWLSLAAGILAVAFLWRTVATSSGQPG